MKKFLKSPVLRYIILSLLAAVIGFNIYSANASGLVGNKLPMPFGYGAAVVLSGSMEPELSINDLIIVKKTDDFQVDQVVVYQDGNSLVVHRILEIRENEVITKGDANNTEDEPIEKSRIKGKVIFMIPGVGNIVEFIKTPLGTILIILLAVAFMEIPRLKEKQKDLDEIEKIKEEIRKLKEEQK